MFTKLSDQNEHEHENKTQIQINVNIDFVWLGQTNERTIFILDIFTNDGLYFGF